ncbi:carbamoyltransferase family protein [Streptomyces acidiscabies]|uniref:carbamoyltransferase family protein n=1 Tax=Streptomyces acidiscabies TaxID=42234 RepID=UPI00073E7C3B|nr:carbamoyltransferase C-terminal domain-containing protein [Streptomyces acidiscabies]GAQ51268.1 decarbamoylnovobiocin carbamoyltransferase [Streptomyces acidiscabies]GAV38366.1 decarbamoylnovobiocin carbamoyltransferase [Streptomyces acidiscabies]
MLALGLGGSNHDFSACLVENGEIAVGIEEERLRRRKYAVNVNSLANQCWRYCLTTHEVRLADVDAIVADDTLLPSCYFPFRSRTTLIRHHLAHAASAFLPSPFPEAAVLVVDGAGSLFEGQGVETLTMSVGNGTEITEISKVYGTNWSTDGLREARVYQAGDSDHSLGFMYKAVSRAIGFTLYEEGPWYLTEDGKTMGLAPYGSDRYRAEFRRHLALLPEGRFELHLKDGGLLDFVEHALDGLEGDERFARGADLAWAAQDLLETAVLHAAGWLHRETGLTRLCLAGGVVLNSVANGKILRHTPFTDVFAQPAAGDNGCAVGCAYYGYHVLGEQPRPRGPKAPSTAPRPQRHTYLGRRYATEEIQRALDASGLPHRRVERPARLAAGLLPQGALIGWFTGGSEFGPRALGHRSILADPRRAEMKDILNSKVKHREAFRPFAPAVLAHRAAEYFDLAIESPYMLLVAPVRDDKRQEVPAITHVDGTARVQTLTPEANGAFYELVERFGELTSVPVVLNTSFNDRGEPIVETPEQALAFFGPSQLDYLFLEDFVVAHSATDLDTVTEAGA